MYAALDAVQLIQVDYDVLPFVLSAQEALKEDSPLVAECLEQIYVLTGAVVIAKIWTLFSPSKTC